jgi:hypothetical protein
MLELLRRHGRHIVIDWPTVDDQDNAAALAWCWNRGQALCVLEQDVVPTLEDLVRLELCSRSGVCSQATHCGGNPLAGYDFRIRQPDGSLRWGREGEEWADTFPLGCTVFHPDVMRRATVPVERWQQLDTALSMRLGLRAHIHWPAAEHNH